MLDFIRDTEHFLATATAAEAQADCSLTRAALGLDPCGIHPPRLVDTLADWLTGHDWWWLRAEDAVTRHCGGCPDGACARRRAAAARGGAADWAEVETDATREAVAA